jgi:hypothetical protein
MNIFSHFFVHYDGFFGLLPSLTGASSAGHASNIMSLDPTDKRRPSAHCPIKFYNLCFMVIPTAEYAQSRLANVLGCCQPTCDRHGPDAMKGQTSNSIHKCT